jgi:dGTPase
MLSREEIEQREIDLLAPFAIKSRFTRGRAFLENEHPYRSVFQRDKDRIIFSAAFRRLQYKTQVFTNVEGDYYRTRLTHTLEVSQIARSLARSLLLNEDLCEAIALSHDLGHGPFGHIGEKILNACMAEDGGFEHNTQSYRVVEELEDIYTHGKGLNLTFETKEGLKKHSYLVQGTGLPSSYAMLEAQVVDRADEIAYNCHDIDDGLRSGMFSELDLVNISLWQRIMQKVKEEHPQSTHFQYVRLMIRYLVNEQVTDLLVQSEQNIRNYGIASLDDIKRVTVPIISFSHDMEREIQDLKRFLYEHFYRNPHVTRIIDLAEACIRGLFSVFLANPELMPRHFADKVRSDEKSTKRIICDYIAGMTDRFAYETYQRVCLKKE